MVTLARLSAVLFVELRVFADPVAVIEPLVLTLSAVPPVTVTEKLANESVPTALPVMPEPFEFVTLSPRRVLPLASAMVEPVAREIVGAGPEPPIVMPLMVRPADSPMRVCELSNSRPVEYALPLS